MALNQYISVKVCGNPDSNSGFVPILLFNSPSFAVEDQFYVGFDNCSYFYTIKTTKSQTIFKLVKNNVRSYGAARAGSLVIAFSIPKNYKLDGGYSPYDVLGKLKSEFLKMCMTCKDSIRETYEYNSGRIDQHVLDEVSSEFTISPCPCPNREMNPNSPIGYLVRTDSEIEKLFHDINYPEFDNFSEVIVAESVNQTSYTPITNIQIPRPKSYSVFVDGRLHGSYTNPNESIIVPSTEPSEFYENKKVSFTIQNLLDKDLISASGIEFDEGAEMIKVSTKGWAIPKRRKIELHIVPKDYENYILTHSHLISITWPYGEIKLDQDFSFTLIGEQIAEIKRNSIKLSLKPNDRYKLVNYDIYGDELRATVSEIRPPVVQRTAGAGQHRYQQQEKVTDLQVIKTSPVYDVSILLGGKVKFEESNEIDVKLKTHPGRSNLTLATCRTKFRAISKSNEAFEGHFYVPKELSHPYLYLYFQINDKSYITKQPLSFNNDKAVVEESDFVISNVEPFYKKRSFLIKLLIPLIAILLGLIIGFALYDGIKSLFGGTNPAPVTADTFYGEGGSSMTENQAFDFLKDADDALKSKDLKFSKVDELYNKYMEFRDVIEEVDENRFDNKVCDRIEDYSKVVSYVTNRDVEKLRAAMADFDHNDLHIWPQHAEPLKQILKDDPTIKRFRNNSITITQFDKIVDAIQDLSPVSEVEMDFVCSQCGASFETEAKLNSHKPSHDVATTYTCDKCQETFTSKSKLKAHKEKVHSNPKRFSCSICGPDVYFKTQAELDSHKKSKHER